MAIVNKTFRCGVTLRYDNSDSYESKVEDYGHINPSLEFWLNNNASNYSNALVVGAGFGLSSKQLVEAGATVTSIEPNSFRYNLLEDNVPESTNINKAVGSSAGTSNISYYGDNLSGGKLDGGFEFDDSIEVITVDSLDLTLDLMLVYANGKELDVIAGASETIANNPGMKIIMKWVPDLLDDVSASITQLQSLDKTIHIIHWEEDDSISLRTQFNGDHHDDILVGVQHADLLLE